MEIALYQPEIPGNVGAALRTAACMGARAHIVEPCGFAFSMDAFRRSAMDYADAVDIVRHPNWAAFAADARARNKRIALFTTRGAARIDAVRFTADDILLFGSESAGVPDPIHAAADLRVRIPIRAGLRSLNLSVAVGVALAEALRQTKGLPQP